MTSSAITVPAALPDTELSEFKPIRGRFEKEGIFNVLRGFYGEEQIRVMQDKGVDSRMVFGINAYYMALIRGEGLKDSAGSEILPAMPPSVPLQHLVVPVVAEAADVSGERDPSNQIRYSPDALKGKILHKYDEIVLAYSALACSAHCRYCYRLDLFNGSTGKGLIKPEELRDYVMNYNSTLAQNSGVDAVSGEKRWPISEVLLSGGDPMVLSNKQLYKYLVAGAQAGVDVIRIGTKEMAFRPMRFDENLAETLRIFHAQYPSAHINIVTHFTHPDEFLERDAEGNYRTENGQHVWLKPVKSAVENMSRLGFVSMENQTPVIRHVNDSVKALHLLHRELRRGGIAFKYIFQCREIEGHKAFAVTVEEAWRLHNEAQKGLSDGARSRFVMSTEWGKLEVVSVTEPSPAHSQGDVVIARRNPRALWITGYEDRIIYDGRKQGVEKFTDAPMPHVVVPELHVA
jgi:lysine 2,3-aminomutase